MSSDSNSVRIQPLGTQNYSIWSMKMKAFLIIEGLWAVVDPDSNDKETRSKSKENEKALGQIILRLEDYLLSSASEYDFARDLWKHLASTFKGKNKATRGLLRQTLLGLSKEPKEPVSKYVERARGIWTDLKSTGDAMEESDLCFSIMQGLPKQFDTIVTFLNAQARDLSLGVLLPQLMQVEQQFAAELATEAKRSEGLAYAARVHGSHESRRRCFQCGKIGHIRMYCPENGKGRALPRGKEVALATRVNTVAF